MINFDNTFDRIDRFFINKKKSETLLIFLLIFVFVGFFLHSNVFPITDTKLKQTTRMSQHINKKLLDEKAYLASVSRDGNENYMIERTKQDIENARVLFEKTHLANSYVDEKLKQLSYLLFNNKDWANFLNTITLLAQKYAIHIKVIDNKVNEPNIQKIEQILNLKIEFNGDFYNTMKFVNSIEESELVVDIYDFNCTATKKNLEGIMNIAVWGMKY